MSRAAALKIDDGLHAFYAASKPIVEEELIAAVKHTLPYYSVPTRWHFVLAIPLTANGKVNRVVLGDLAAERRTRAESVTATTTNVSRIDTITSAVEVYQPTSSSSCERSLDLEKKPKVIETANSTPTSDSSKSIIDIEKGPVVETDLAGPEVPNALPEKRGLHGQRWLRHRAFVLYRRFFSIVRVKYHNTWEMSHRFGGWTTLILLWIQIFFATKDLNPNIASSTAYLNSPPVWLTSIATAATIFPWLHLKKVAIRSEVLSNHAIRLWFDYTTPVVGTAVRLAERPLVDWHGFATIPNPKTARNPDATGFSLIMSRAGDFTDRQIERAPTHIWMRGIPTCGVLRIATLFKSVVLVATGSGIETCLAVVLAKKVPARILWTAPNPEQTFGKGIVDSVLNTDPNAVIHNTRTMGKPDMSLMAYRMWRESGAEAVCIISNKKFTTKVVYDLEARGIPAYGAIFDS